MYCHNYNICFAIHPQHCLPVQLHDAAVQSALSPGFVESLAVLMPSLKISTTLNPAEFGAHFGQVLLRQLCI